MTLKKILPTLTFSAALSAAPLLPTLNPDSQSLDWNNPGLGARLYAIFNTNWLLGGNDNICIPGQLLCGDQDNNDAMANVEFDSFGVARVNWIGANSALVNYLMVQGLRIDSNNTQGTFTAPRGSEITVEMHTGEGQTFVSGHQNVGIWGPTPTINPVPEPATLTFIGIALMGLALLRGKRETR